MTGHWVEDNTPGPMPDQTTQGKKGPSGFQQVPRRWTPPAETALGRARRTASFDPLIQAWSSAAVGRPALTAAERDLLTAIRLSVQSGANLLLRLPGGVHRIPLLAAVMIAADTLDMSQAALSDLSGMHPPPGPVALVTTRLVRRSELDRLDASSAPVAPALHPHRLRGDGLASPVRGGRPRLVTGAARLLFVSPATGFPPVVGVLPRVVVIDAASEPDCEWLTVARGWAAAHGSLIVTVVDLHEKSIGNATLVSDKQVTRATLPNPPTVGGENTWIVDWPWLQATGDGAPGESPAPSNGGTNQTAGVRGRGHLLAVEDASVAGLAEVRERLQRLRNVSGGPAPWPICRAARLARLLTELPTRTADYDRVAPRYEGRTLRRLLDDVLDADGRNDFPASWRARVAADWGAIRASLSTVYDALSDHNPLTEIVADLVEDASRRGQRLDVVCGSRTARDALTGRLVSNGSLSIEDAPLVTIRSINTVEAAGSHRSTLLIGTPAVRWRGRLAAADFGELTVLGRRGDDLRLYHALSSAFSAPSRREARDTRCATLVALTGVAADEDELDGCDINVGVTARAIVHRPSATVSLPSQDTLAAAAMTEPQYDADLALADLETEADECSAAADHDSQQHSRRVLALPVLVQSTAREAQIQPATVFLLAMSARVQRLRDDDIRLLAVTEITPGMTLLGVSEPERRTLFDRVRPLIAKQRPHVASLLLQLWQVALDDATTISGSVMNLTDRLNALGADITSSAVAQWSDARRIGPIDPQNVARIGRVAGSAVVAGEASRIAAVMRTVRIHHSTVGAALVKLAGWHAAGDTAALDRAAETLGAEIADLCAELSAWRVIAVGEAVFAPASGLRRPWSVDQVSQMCQPAGDPSAAAATSDEAAAVISFGAHLGPRGQR